MNKTKNTSLLIILAVILSLIIGFVNYNYLSVKSIPLTFTSSVFISLPDNNKENTFILSNKSVKEWSSIQELQTSADNQIATDPKKAEAFNIKYTPDIGNFLKNYFQTIAIQNKIANQFGQKVDFNTEKPFYITNTLGNGYITVDSYFKDKSQALQFGNSITEEFNKLVTELNLSRSESNKLIPAVPKINIIENNASQTKSILNFISAFIISLSILIYLILALKNRLNIKQ
jgi:hypothetical protein